MSLAPLAVEGKCRVRRRDSGPALLQAASAAVVRNPADNQAGLAADHTVDLAPVASAPSSTVQQAAALLVRMVQLAEHKRHKDQAEPHKAQRRYMV
jgi:hypothetical protein